MPGAGTSTSFSFSNRNLEVTYDFQAVGAPSTSAQMNSTTTALPASSNPFHQEFQNYTSTGPIPLATQVVAGGPGDFGAAHLNFRAFVNMKASSQLSTAASIQVAFLETATSTGYAPTYTIATEVFAGATSTDSSVTLFMAGAVPFNAGCQFARVNFANFSSQTQAVSTNVDAFIEAA